LPFSAHEKRGHSVGQRQQVALKASKLSSPLVNPASFVLKGLVQPKQRDHAWMWVDLHQLTRSGLTDDVGIV
jgi:hypothetical protein